MQNLFRYDGQRVLVGDGGAGNGMLTGGIKPPSLAGR
jgi:hypothetical protein